MYIQSTLKIWLIWRNRKAIIEHLTSIIINTLILISNSKYTEDQNTDKESLISYSILGQLKWKLYYSETTTLIEHRVFEDWPCQERGEAEKVRK